MWVRFRECCRISSGNESMSNGKIILEWLRDSVIGFVLILAAIAAANWIHGIVSFYYPSLYWCWYAVSIVPFCLFARWRGVSGFESPVGIVRWIAVVPVAILGARQVLQFLIRVLSPVTSLVSGGFDPEVARFIQLFVIGPSLWGTVAVISAWATIAMAPGYKRATAIVLLVRIAVQHRFTFAMLFSAAESPLSTKSLWQVGVVAVAQLSGTGVLVWLTWRRPHFWGCGEAGSFRTDQSVGRLPKMLERLRVCSSRYRRVIGMVSVLVAVVIPAGVMVHSVWRTSLDQPSFIVTLPDSQHPARGNGVSRRSGRIAVVRLNAQECQGMVPPGTFHAWRRWLVIRVQPAGDAFAPRYYFLDQESPQVVGPWSPEGKVYLERFDTGGRFVAFERDSFMSHRSLTRRIHHFDPSSGNAGSFEPAALDAWQECFSLDGTTMAAVSGGFESPLTIHILNVRDGATRRTLEFPERQSMPPKLHERERCGRQWAISSEGNTLALTGKWIDGEGANVVELWSTTTGELLHRIERAALIGKLKASVTAVRFSPDGKSLIVELWTGRKTKEVRRIELKTNEFRDGFNPWEGLTWERNGNHGYGNGVVGMDGRHVLWWRRPKFERGERTTEWEVRVTDIEGNVERDWKNLPTSVASKNDDRLNAQIVPGSGSIVILNEFEECLSRYDWKVDELRRFATTHKRHNSVELYSALPGRIFAIYREQNADIVVKVWNTPVGE